MLRFRSVKHDTVIHHMFLVLRFHATCTVRFIPIATESWLFGATEVAFAHFYARHLKLPGIVAEQRSTKANAFQQKAATASQPEAILLKPESESYQSWQCIAQIFSTRLTPKMEHWKIVVVGFGHVWMSRLPGIDWCRQREASATLVSLSCARIAWITYGTERKECTRACFAVSSQRTCCFQL